LGAGRSLLRFLLLGLGGTACYLSLYLTLRSMPDPLPAQAANVSARVLVAVPTTWLNGRYAFRGARLRPTKLVGGALTVLAAGTVLSAGVLALEEHILPTADRVAEVCGLVTANLVATAARFTLLRSWLFPSHRTADTQPARSLPPASSQRIDVDSAVGSPRRRLADRSAPATRGNR
jgi:putative flippase GtrA